MAGFNAVLDTKQFSDKRVLDDRHPAIVITRAFKANNGTIPAGELVAYDVNGDVVSFDPAGIAPVNDPVGVCVHDVDTAKVTIGGVVVHGTVVSAALTVKGADADADDIDLLAPAIFAF